MKATHTTIQVKKATTRLKKLYKTKIITVDMKPNNKNNNNALYMILIFAAVSLICEIGFCSESPGNMKLGGLRNIAQNNGEIESIGRFAVQQHNNNQNSFLEFARIVKAREQVVAGKMYHLTLEAIDGGKKKMYEAKVWVKPWMNFKELQEFKQVDD